MIYLHGEVHYPRFTHQTQFLLSYMLIHQLIFPHDSGDLHLQLPPDHSKKLYGEQFHFLTFCRTMSSQLQLDNGRCESSLPQVAGSLR